MYQRRYDPPAHTDFIYYSRGNYMPFQGGAIIFWTLGTIGDIANLVSWGTVIMCVYICSGVMKYYPSPFSRKALMYFWATTLAKLRVGKNDPVPISVLRMYRYFLFAPLNSSRLIDKKYKNALLSTKKSFSNLNRGQSRKLMSGNTLSHLTYNFVRYYFLVNDSSWLLPT